MSVWPGVLLCVLAPHPACVRYKVRHARLVGGGSGTKFALLGQNLPNWAFLGEQGEFYTGSGAVRLVQGEFFRGEAAVETVLGELFRARPARVHDLHNFVRHRQGNDR